MHATYHSEQQAEILEGLQALRALYHLLRSNPQLDPKTGQFLLAQKQEEAVVKKTKSITLSDLQAELDFDATILDHDLQTALRWGQALSLRTQDRAVWVMQ